MEGVSLFSILAVAFGLGMMLFDRSRRRTMLARVSERLGGEHDATSAAWGSALGPYATFSFVKRRNRSSKLWTEIDVELPGRYPLTLHVRRHNLFDKLAIERGNMVDIEVGDAEFDEDFLVESAPVDVVRRLLTPRVRRYFKEHRNVELCTPSDREGILRLSLRGWTNDLSEADEALDVAIELSTRVREAFAEAVAETPSAPAAGSPFRQELDDRQALVAQARREIEVAQISHLRAKRESFDGPHLAILLVGIGSIATWLWLLTR